MTDLPSLAKLDDVRAVLDHLPERDDMAVRHAIARESQLTKPEGSLGQLEAITRWMSGWQAKHPPHIGNVRALVFAGNHGVAHRGVSAFPPEVTGQMVENFAAGGAAINQICATFDVDLDVIPLELDRPTHDFLERPAMDDEECAALMDRGAQAVDPRADLLILGEMGIGNTTSAAAICMALFGGKAVDWVGPGTGVEGETLGRKIAVVDNAVRLHQPNLTDGLEILRHLGGRELAAIAGAVIGARMHGIPVILDGFICTAAAAPLQGQRPGALDHCMVGHRSREPGHGLLLRNLDVAPILDLDLRLGEASGAALAVGIVRAALACHNGMATFGEAGVSNKSDHIIDDPKP